MHKSCSTLKNLDGISHGFFTRMGGVSDGIYGSLNCGYGSGDERGKVAENRARVAESLGAKTPDILTAYQVHSASAVIVESPFSPDNAPQADALVTRIPGIVLGVLTADCTPILLADPEARVIATAHAGWKGAVGGIIDGTLAAMQRLGADNKRVIATIGPCIAQASYEVGADFRATFLAENPENVRFFKESRSREGHFHFDLGGFVQQKLVQAGVARVEWLAYDTCADEAEFFSYRRTTLRGEGAYGRQVSAIMLQE